MACNPFTLMLMFHGLIAFVVPMKNGTGHVPEVWSVMVDATDVRTVPAFFLDLNQCSRTCTCPAGVKGENLLHPHRAAIRYRSKNVEAAGDNSLRIWVLDGYDLSLDFAGSTGDVEIAGGRLISSEQPDLSDPKQISDFSWVPEISKASGRLGKIHPSVTNPTPDEELRERVAGRIKLNGGLLRTGSVSTEIPILGAPLRPRLFSFEPQIHGRILRQALADTVLYTTTVTSCDVKLRGHRFGDTTNIKTLVLSPAAAESVVVVEIVNVQEEFLLYEHGSPDVYDSQGGENFLWFYKIASDNMGPFPIPSFSGGPVNGKPYCPMATFQP
jgi:hypothetical protein